MPNMCHFGCNFYMIFYASYLTTTALQSSKVLENTKNTGIFLFDGYLTSWMPQGNICG